MGRRDWWNIPSFLRALPCPFFPGVQCDHMAHVLLSRAPSAELGPLRRCNRWTGSPHSLAQESANTSIKSQIVNTLCFTGHVVSVFDYSALPLQCENSCQRYRNEWVRLCANKTLLIRTRLKSGIDPWSVVGQRLCYVISQTDGGSLHQLFSEWCQHTSQVSHLAYFPAHKLTLGLLPPKILYKFSCFQSSTVRSGHILLVHFHDVLCGIHQVTPGVLGNKGVQGM